MSFGPRRVGGGSRRQPRRRRKGSRLPLAVVVHELQRAFVVDLQKPTRLLPERSEVNAALPCLFPRVGRGRFSLPTGKLRRRRRRGGLRAARRGRQEVNDQEPTRNHSVENTARPWMPLRSFRLGRCPRRSNRNSRVQAFPSCSSVVPPAGDSPSRSWACVSVRWFCPASTVGFSGRVPTVAAASNGVRGNRRFHANAAQPSAVIARPCRRASSVLSAGAARLRSWRSVSGRWFSPATIVGISGRVATVAAVSSGVTSNSLFRANGARPSAAPVCPLPSRGREDPEFRGGRSTSRVRCRCRTMSCSKAT